MGTVIDSYAPSWRAQRGFWALPWLWITATLIWATPTNSWSHTGGENHRAIVSVEEDAIRVLLMMQIPNGKRTRRILARYDLDRNGRLDELESQFVGAHLGREVVGGWLLTVGDKAPRPESLAARARITDGGSLLVALLLEYPPAAGQRVEIRVLPAAAGSAPNKVRAVLLEVQAPAGIRKSSLEVAHDAPVIGPVMLAPGGGGAWIDPIPSRP